MNVYSKEIVVSEKDIDWNNHVNNLVYLQWALDISSEHWHSQAPEDIINSHFWVVRSHHIEYKKQAFLNEIIQINTYVSNAKGALSERIVDIYRKEELLAKVKSTWCFMQKEPQKVARISETVRLLFL